MKLSKLAALVKQNNMAMIINDERGGEIARQLIHVGGAIYPLDGFPKLDRETLLMMLDIPADKRENFAVSEHSMTESLARLTDDFADGEKVAELATTTLVVPGEKVIPVCTAEGMRFLLAEYHAVIADESEVEWWTREVNGGTVLVAKRGFQVIAVIESSIAWITQRAGEELESISRAVSVCVSSIYKANDEQMRM